MKKFTTYLTGTALAVAATSGAALAQKQAEPMTDTPEAAQEMEDEMPTADAAAEAETSFTDQEIEGFAAAALKIQALDADPATKQQEAAQLVAESGIDTETFNAISRAMQSDPEVAKRVQIAGAELQKQSAG
ncbi:MAG: DUF4168 domain-containing protein [Erythrobacter sp.]